MIKRWQLQNLKKGLKSRRIVFISGARQCGKTTLAKSIQNNNIDYITLDDPVLLTAARTDPNNFVKRNGDTLIIDEIQKAPELLASIKKAVDDNQESGQYLLTGSANILNLPGNYESLAGRVKYVRLRPFSQGEILGKKPDLFDRFFKKKFHDAEATFDQDEVLSIAFKGGFPETLSFDREERRSWFRDYVAALLERDLKDVMKIYRMDKIKKLLEVSAAWSGKFIDTNAICSKLGIQRNTYEGYVQALKTLYLVEDIQPWINTDYERVGKKAKFYLSDCGLMISLLNLSFAETRLNPDQSGKIIETLVANELLVHSDFSNEKFRVFQYRDREKREIDFIIEGEDGKLLAIEVKAGANITAKSFTHMRWFRDNLAKDNFVAGVVLYTGQKVINFDDDLWAVPMANLWM